MSDVALGIPKSFKNEIRNMRIQLTAIKALICRAVALMLILFLYACKKDQLIVDHDKHFISTDHKVDINNPFDGGWGLKLSSNGVAQLTPSGDIYYVGTYKINGKNITVKTDQQTFKFEILSETEIKEKKYGILMRLYN